MRRLTATTTLVAVALALAGCGGTDTPTPTGTRTITVTFSGSDVTPNGDRVEVGTGQRIELKVTADRPGEIHVHSDPEQELAYGKGTTPLELTPIDKPGIVEVESHTLDKTIVQLEVR